MAHHHHRHTGSSAWYVWHNKCVERRENTQQRMLNVGLKTVGKIDERNCKCSRSPLLTILLLFYLDDDDDKNLSSSITSSFTVWNIEFYGNEKILFSMDCCRSESQMSWLLQRTTFLQRSQSCHIFALRTKFINLGNCGVENVLWAREREFFQNCCKAS